MDNTMAKRTNNDLQNTAQKTKDLATRIPLNTGGELGCSPEGYVIPALLVAPIVLLLLTKFKAPYCYALVSIYYFLFRRIDGYT